MITITGVTKRTLHYYDEINLLNPDSYSDKGYRLYNHENLKKITDDFAVKGIRSAIERNSGDYTVAKTRAKEDFSRAL